MKKSTKKLLINIGVIVALTLITILVLYFSYKDDFDINEIIAFLRISKGWCIAAAFGCMLLFIFFEGLALWVIARRLGHKSKIHQSLAYSTSDIYYSALTPSASGGQPASMFYMTRDGMSVGTSGFALILNLMGYTSAIIIMGIAAFIMSPNFYGNISNWVAQVLLIVGFVMQCLLLGFFIMCLLWSKALLKVGHGVIKLGAKLKIVKDPDKYIEKWTAVVEKYRGCRETMKQHPTLVVVTIILNLIQRVSQTLIPCFICYGAAPGSSFADLFVMQTFVLLGYNSIPLPGGVGAYEFMYGSVYGVGGYSDGFILSAMMVSRFISYYICVIISGLYTLVYHAVGIKGDSAAEADGSDEAERSDGDGGTDLAPNEDTKSETVPDREDGSDREDGNNSAGSEKVPDPGGVTANEAESPPEEEDHAD